MSGARLGALRRIGILARASAKDLFAGQGVALVVLALVGVAMSGGEVRSVGEAERHALLLRQRVQLLAALAAAAAVLAAAHAVDEGRRTQRFARLATTPLTALEALAGPLLGVVAGVAAVAVPAQLALLLLPEAGLLRRHDQFAPCRVVEPSRVELVRGDGARLRWRRGPALLEAGTALELGFEVEAGAHLALEIALARAGSAAPDAPLRWSVTLQGEERIGGVGAGERRMALPLAADARGAVEAVVRAFDGGEVLRIDPAACRLRGPPGSIAASVARAVAGLLVLLLLATAVAGGLATALPDALACAGAGCLLLLASLRSLFLAVSASLGDPHSRAAEAMQEVARTMERLFRSLPDAARLVAAESLSLGARPWSAEDAHALLLALAFSVVAWLLGAAWLRRTVRA